ncbi:MAG TPA: DUF4291 family protein [Pseudonocardiaceae bacterium]
MSGRCCHAVLSPVRGIEGAGADGGILLARPNGPDHSPIVRSRQVRARFDERTITVYQACSPRIAEPALATGAFVAPLRRDRMTWIKPSFLRMRYRSGWATKPGQERVLSISITRAGFEWALRHSCPSSHQSDHCPDVDTWRRHPAASPGPCAVGSGTRPAPASAAPPVPAGRAVRGGGAPVP